MILYVIIQNCNNNFGMMFFNSLFARLAFFEDSKLCFFFELVNSNKSPSSDMQMDKEMRASLHDATAM